MAHFPNEYALMHFTALPRETLAKLKFIMLSLNEVEPFPSRARQSSALQPEPTGVINIIGRKGVIQTCSA